MPRMIAKLEEGYNLVAGWRKHRQDRALSRKLPSKIANWLISESDKTFIHDYGCTLKIMRADVAKNIQLYGMHRFIPAIAAEYSMRIAEIPCKSSHTNRGGFQSGSLRTFRVLLNLLTVKFFLRYSTRPLHMFGKFKGIRPAERGQRLLAKALFAEESFSRWRWELGRCCSLAQCWF